MHDQKKTKEQLIEELNQLREKLRSYENKMGILGDIDLPKAAELEKRREEPKSETEVILVDKILNMKEILQDKSEEGEDDEFDTNIGTKTEFIILDKLMEQHDPERKKIIEQTRAIKNFYKGVLRKIVNGVWVADKNDVIYYANQGMADISGMTRGEIIGSKVLTDFPERDAENFSHYYHLAKKSLQSISYDKIFILTPSGKPTYQSGWLIPLVAEDQFNGMVCTVEDVTERKHAEEVLRESERQLKEAIATKDKFFSILAHDLKNPLTSFINGSYLLSRYFDKLSEEKIKETINLIDKSANHLQKMLENLLQWSRSQMGRIQFQPRSHNLKAIVDNTISVLSGNAEMKNIRLFNKIDEDMHVFADENMLSTVIRNLISNAIKFTPPNGKVKIEAAERGGRTEVAITDTGVGIEKKDIDKLFRIDVHYSTDGTAKEKGTGLGLILCKEFVERHSGEIWVESKPGKGSRFRFCLPKE
jgi:PAS domain S-box-containing protein